MMKTFKEATTSFPLLLVRIHFLLLLLITVAISPLASHACNQEEKMALLNFKSSLEDPSNRLSSWQEGTQHRNCCNWEGISCSNETHNVISINLRNVELENYIYQIQTKYNKYTFNPPSTSLKGKISHSLFNITHLEYLDLGFNDFHHQEPRIPFRFSELPKLTHLDLSYTNFTASISTHFNNLASLRYLDLSCKTFYFSTSCFESSSTEWMRGLVNLQVLRLSGIDLFEATSSSKENLAQHISFLWNLRDLDISRCNISGPVFPIRHFHNLSRLVSFKIDRNFYLNSSIPIQFTNLTSLSFLDLSLCDLQGSIPYLPQLKELDVSNNYDLHTDLTRIFEQSWPRLQKLKVSLTNAFGTIPSSISNAPLLVSLSASRCSIQGSLPSSISNLKYLNFLDLSGNQIQGPIPKSMCNISPLRHLNIGSNNITGTIPSCIKNLRNLSLFDVSRNSVRGNVSLIFLINELNITSLSLSSNKLTIVIEQHLYPLKKLQSLQLQSCNIGGFIPAFICNCSHLEDLDLSDNNLTGEIPPCFTKLKKLISLKLSGNKLSGPLPLLPPGLNLLDLSNNTLSGEISMENGERLSSLSYIYLNNNQLSGSIPSSLCSQKPRMSNTSPLEFINLSHNKLSGNIPSSVGYCTSLIILTLNNNNLTGNVPYEINGAKNMVHFVLNDNNLDGTFPMFILNFLSLQVLNLGNNNFEGILPTGLGSLSELIILLLRSNRFNGSIPEDIFHLQELEILDLSLNNLSGTIPLKLGNLTRLTSISFEYLIGYTVQYQLGTKGIVVELENFYLYNSGIDLSCNILSGTIPEEMGLLQGLRMLNLSHNIFSSRIPESLGNMSSLESLDLSFNRLSGHIPQSLTSVDSLGFLNLSHNNLSGKIPRGNHFDTLTFDGSVFAGNDLLCGLPNEKECFVDRTINIGEDEEDPKEDFLLYAIVVMGFVVGFWGLFFVLLLKKHKWWIRYWRIVHYVAVKIVEGCKM